MSVRFDPVPPFSISPKALALLTRLNANAPVHTAQQIDDFLDSFNSGHLDLNNAPDALRLLYCLDQDRLPDFAVKARLLMDTEGIGIFEGHHPKNALQSFFAANDAWQRRAAHQLTHLAFAKLTHFMLAEDATASSMRLFRTIIVERIEGKPSQPREMADLLLEIAAKADEAALDGKREEGLLQIALYLSAMRAFKDRHAMYLHDLAAAAERPIRNLNRLSI